MFDSAAAEALASMTDRELALVDVEIEEELAERQVGGAVPVDVEIDEELAEAQVSGAMPVETAVPDAGSSGRRLPRWVLPAIATFWVGYLVMILTRSLWSHLSALLLLVLLSVFLALAIEPGVNRLARRGWRRGTATALIMTGVLGVIILFVVAIGTLVASQVAELLQNSESYITDTVKFLNDTFGTNIDARDVIRDFNDPNGRLQQFIESQQNRAVSLSFAVLGGLLQLFTVLLFTFYLVADGPRMRRAICSRLTPIRQEQVLSTWELAANKTGSYLYSRALLALLSGVFHWIVFQSLGTAAPVALALWVGVVSQFLPVVGTYIAGVLPVLLTFLDSPLKALIVLGFIVIYQQIENYFFSPRITARTMELHPALAFGAALGGAAVLGVVGAVLALPATAMVQALLSEVGGRHRVIKSALVDVRDHRVLKRWARLRKRAAAVRDE